MNEPNVRNNNQRVSFYRTTYTPKHKTSFTHLQSRVPHNPILCIQIRRRLRRTPSIPVQPQPRKILHLDRLLPMPSLDMLPMELNLVIDITTQIRNLKGLTRVGPGIALPSDLDLALHELALLCGADKLARLRVLCEGEHAVEVMLTELVSTALRGPDKEPPDEARHAVVRREGRAEVQDAPDGDKVRGVGVVLDMADGAVQCGRR